jgi:hypothetical protein
MRRTLALAAVSLALTVAVSGQSDKRRIETKKVTADLIERSRQYVAETRGAEVVDTPGVLKPTPSGLMPELEVKSWLSAELESPVVSIKDKQAIVTGLIIYKRSPSGPPMRSSGSVRVYYIKEGGHWKYMGLCLGNCGIGKLAEDRASRSS